MNSEIQFCLAAAPPIFEGMPKRGGATRGGDTGSGGERKKTRVEKVEGVEALRAIIAEKDAVIKQMAAALAQQAAALAHATPSRCVSVARAASSRWAGWAPPPPTQTSRGRPSSRATH